MTVVDRSRTETSWPRKRGTIRHLSNAARLAIAVRSVPALPATYPNASGENRSCAAASSPTTSIGNSGGVPSMPLR